jgi:ketosteroid isomerase-like protein
MSHARTVTSIYDAFARGDLPGILAHLHEDVEWEYGGMDAVPWLRSRRGHAGATEFFTVLAGSLDITRFEPKAILGQGDLVIGVIDVEFTVRSSGHEVREEDEVHVWWFRGDKVARFRHRADTALAVRALG